MQPGASRTLTAEELESGEGDRAERCARRTGGGKWRLGVTSDRPVQVMSLLSSPTGHLTNLSTVPRKVALGVEETAAEVFREHVSGPIVQSQVCRSATSPVGPIRETRGWCSYATRTRTTKPSIFRNSRTSSPRWTTAPSYILNKIQGVAHGGGVQVPAGSDEFADMERFLQLLGEAVTPVTLTPQTLFDTVQMAPLRKTLRRAALIFAGRIPTDAEYAAVQRGGTAAREAIRGLMTGPEFHEFLIRAANDRLLTDRDDRSNHRRTMDGYFVDFTNETYRRRKAALEGGDRTRGIRGISTIWYGHGAARCFRRAPLELIAHVVENDLPYTEILTADYIMANPMAAEAYGAPTHHFDDPEDVHEFKPSRIVSYYRHGDGFETRVRSRRRCRPCPRSRSTAHHGLSARRHSQHDGISRGATPPRPPTATGHARAGRTTTSWVSTSRSPPRGPPTRMALADTNNPTLRNPACTVCHRRHGPGRRRVPELRRRRVLQGHSGAVLDSLDHLYKARGGVKSREVRADSWKTGRHLSWPVSLAAGDQHPEGGLRERLLRTRRPGRRREPSFWIA